MDFIPEKDADFNNWANSYVKDVKINFAALGLTQLQATNLDNAFAAWESGYTGHSAALAAADAALQIKLSTNTALKTIIREYTKIIQANPAITNSQKAALGITVYKATRTPSPVPTTRPIADVDNRQRFEHIIHFFNEGSHKSKAKPEGVRGCEIWCKVGGTAPLDSSELKFLATDTKTPYIARFEGTDAGKTVHYMLRWINTRSEVGPWSETISVTISA